MRKLYKLLLGLSVAITPMSSIASNISGGMINTWNSGDTLSSTQMNTNFSNVRNAVNDNDGRITGLETGTFYTDANITSAGMVQSATIATGSPVCTLIEYTPTRNEVAVLDGIATAGSASGMFISAGIMYSTDNGATWDQVGGTGEFNITSLTLPISASTHEWWPLSSGVSYRFGVGYSTNTTPNQSSCRLRLFTLPR